jgi:accessory colonization factor AcfC
MTLADVLEKSAEEISLTEFCELQRTYVEMHAHAKSLEKAWEDFKETAKPVEMKIQAIMLAQNLKSMPIDNNLLVLSQRSLVATPKTQEEKQAFFDWLKTSRGIDAYWHYVGINSQSLQGLWAEEKELAVERKDIDFTLPGVGKETVTHKLSVRKR